MKCYIYKIINKVTNEKYVGQTTNFSRRIEDHLYKLRNNKHINPKLQASWNKYGEENFLITKEAFDLTKEELNKKEKEEIIKEDSYNHGFNLTYGGDGGNTRGNLTFEDFCFIYFGNKKYAGMTNRTAKFKGIDSSTVSSIARDEAYLWYKNRALLLSEEEKQKWVEEFEKQLEINENPPVIKSKSLSQNQVIDFLCVVSSYGRGAEAAITRFYGRAKGIKHNIIKGEYKESVSKFLLLSDEEIIARAEKVFVNNDLQKFCTQKIKKLSEVNKKFIMDCAL